jgi:hypothetical protein
MGNRRLPHPDRDLPLQPPRARQRIRDHRLGDWRRMDRVGESDHVRAAGEQDVFLVRWSQLVVDSDCVPLLPGNQSTSAKCAPRANADNLLKDRSLESIAILFMPKSPFSWAAEKSWREHANGDILALDDGLDEVKVPTKDVLEKAELEHSS